MKNHRHDIIPRLYMKLVPVQILLVIIGGINSIIDNAFAGNLIGPGAMAVTGLFAPVTNFLNAVNALLFGGAQLLCGRYLGKKMEERTRGIFSLDVLAILIISFTMTGFCELFPETAAGALGAKADLKADLAKYIRGFAIGLPLFCLGSQFTAFLQLEHKEKYSYTAIIAMFLSNAFFNWLLIDVMKMGFLGLGLSTSIGNTVFFIIQAAYYFSGKAVIRFSKKSIRFSDLADIAKNGLPPAITQVCIFIRGLILNSLIQHYVGEDGLSALSAISCFGSVYWAVPAGVTSAVMVLGSIYSGEEDRTSLRTLMQVFLRRGTLLVAGVSLVFSACCVPLTNIFFHDPSAPAYHMAMLGFMLFPLSSPLSAVTVGFSDFYHCLGHEKIVRVTTLADGLFFVAVFSYILIPVFGMPGLWIAQIGNGVATNLILVIFAASSAKRFPASLTDLLCFPKDFGVPDENRLDIAVENVEEVVSASEKVASFCRGHGLEEKRTLYSSVIVEELAGNIVAHGFNDNKKHGIDIRVSLLKDDIIICLKDDCAPFDPKEASKLFDPDDTVHNIGLRLASRLSKSMNYQNTLGLNILTIVL
ncbi:MAG: ATP-binding protein [Lachnospiraceae bacterium]|nr:ATP-binding protein [Lachnospiraceae bacterium]